MESEKVEKTNRVVIFTDIHHFLDVAKNLNEKQYKFLQDFYEIMGEIVVGHGGEFIKYLGDGFLCIFPEDKAEDAAAGAIEMRSAFLEMVRTWKLPVDTELEVGISGGVVAEGVFGHRSLRQKDIFGDVVNQAAVICHHRGVAITEWMYEKIKNKYAVQQLPDIRLKWRDEPMKVWEVEE